MCGIDGIADVLMGRRSEMPYMTRKGNIMLYGWKAKRHLALYVSIVLSCGGYSLLASPHAFADEVTIDTAAPSTSPYGTDRYYAGVSITGNAAGHKLILDSVDVAGYVTGGWAMGATGDATNNTVELKGNARVDSRNVVYGVFGGRSDHGKAINNTVILNGTLWGTNWTILYGGWSGKTGATAADNTAGNTLQVKTKDNVVNAINNFEKMSFVLGNGISSGDTMLTVQGQITPQTFDWGNIKVLGGQTWGTGDDAAKRVILYRDGNDVELTNYAVSGTTEGNWEYGLTTNETTTAATPGATTVNAREIYFDRNKWKNATVTVNTAAASTSPYGADRYHAGVSTLGNSPNANKLILDSVDVAGYVTGGWAMGATGDATNNTVELKGNASVDSRNGVYGVFGGRSDHGKAINNTVILNGKLNGAYWTNLYGGWSGKTGATAADNTAGNTLQVKTKDNVACTINNFEKMSFVLGSGISSGDTMLTVQIPVTTQTYDWKSITVTGLSDWVTALNAAGTNDPKLTLYTGAALTLNNYAPRLIENAGDYEFGTFATGGTLASGTMTNATQIKLAGNKFQNVTLPVVDAATTSVHGGYSSYGNTTNTNVITVNSGAYTNVRAGYTDAVKGGSDKNELTFTGTVSATNLYGGYTTGTSASAVDLKADAAAKADAKGNTVNISGGTVNANGKIAGGYIAKNTTLATPAASAGDAKGNKVNIESGTIGNNTSIYGGYTEGAGGATGNIVTISGGTFSGTSSIYGGYTEGTGKATGNIVNLGKADGTLSATGLTNVTLYGGGGASASDRVKDNVLNVNAKATAKNIQNFGKVMFNFNSTIHTGDTMLTLNDTAGTSLDWKKFGISGGGPDGETTLMHNASGIALTSYDHSRAVLSTGRRNLSSIRTRERARASRRSSTEAIPSRARHPPRQMRTETSGQDAPSSAIRHRAIRSR